MYKIRIGTRNSDLAKAQVDLVINELKRVYKNIEFEIIEILTSGDKFKKEVLAEIGGKQLFTKEIQEALINNEIDLAVHSLKDLECLQPDQLELVAVLEREDPRDCLISAKFNHISELPANSIIGTASIRRKVQLKQLHPNLQFVHFRGNVQTRLNKLDELIVDASMLAVAGLKRLNLDGHIKQNFSIDEMIPSANQGVVGLEIRKKDTELKKILSKINHKNTWFCAQIERNFLKAINGDCFTPAACYIESNESNIIGHFMLASLCGEEFIKFKKIFAIKNADQIGQLAFNYILDNYNYKFLEKYR